MKKTDSNEWILKEEGDSCRARVGLTKKAAHELEQIVFVKLPQVGDLVEKGEEIAVLESLKAAADAYSPAQGRITAVNDKLLKTPNLITTDPYGQGWLYEIELFNVSEYHSLEDHPGVF